MYKSYSDSYLMTKSKKTLIEYLRIAEHNHQVAEETIEQQYKNCQILLVEEYNKALDDFVKIYKLKTSMENKLVDDIAEQLKKK